MLYGLGLILLLLSCAVESESLIVPMVVAVIGIALMCIGGRKEHETE